MTSDKAASIQRYDIGYGDVSPDSTGQYVRYTDHAAALKAAERRVAELERAASNVIRKAQQKSKLTSSVFTNDLQRLEAALAPAKKVD